MKMITIYKTDPDTSSNCISKCYVGIEDQNIRTNDKLYRLK